MIVITNLDNTPREVYPGDQFNLSVTDQTGTTVIIKGEITVTKIIDFIATFRFALEDGTVPGFHLMGVFACQNELPIEFQNAVMLGDLTDTQHENFIASIGTK